jgi:GH15 family glucan-1,4-alpha-glucosidase
LTQIAATAKISAPRVEKIEQAALKKLRQNSSTSHREMVRLAADYLISRLTERGVHGNAFDTWETFIGSFTYSNAAIYAAFVTAHRVLDDEKYAQAAARVKSGVLEHFVREDNGYPFLVRGFDAQGQDDATVDSASLGAIDPFELLDLNNERELQIAEGTLRAITEKLDVEWMGGRAIRRFEGDTYVGGVPACVNTLWMARCCLKVANRLDEINRREDAQELTQRAQTYLQTVLRRSTTTGLLPELMQGPTGQPFWAAPHGWAMSSFVSGTLALAKRLAKS